MVVLVVTSPYGRLGGEVQIRIGCGGENARTVGWVKVQVRIGRGGGERIPVRSSGGRDPDPHRVAWWWREHPYGRLGEWSRSV